MRQLAIAVLGLSVATAASAQDYMHQPKAGGTLFGQKPPAQKASPGPTWPAASTPYQPPAYKPHAVPAAPKSPGDTDGGEAFKPFKGSSTYSDPYKKPAKPKSIYDR